MARALCVLGLVFLGFAHAPASAAADGAAFGLDAAGYCGDPLADGMAHAPCHACRIGGAADLPRPAGPATTAIGITPASFGAGAIPAILAATGTRPGARAPPAV